MTSPIDSILGQALHGLNRAFGKADAAARRIAEGGVEATSATALITAEHEAKANAAVARTADEMHKHAVDILA